MTQQDAPMLVDDHYWARARMLDAVGVLTPEQYTKDLGNSFKSVSGAEPMEITENEGPSARGVAWFRQLGAPAPKPQDLIRFYRERTPSVHQVRPQR